MAKKLSDEDYDFIYSHVPRICVDLVINSEEGVLLTKRKLSPWKGKWHIPGGRIFFGETIEKAIERIAKEELNTTVKVIKNLGYIEYLWEEGRERHSISFPFLVKIISGEIKLDFQASEFSFFKSIPENVVPEQKRFLEERANLIR